MSRKETDDTDNIDHKRKMDTEPSNVPGGGYEQQALVARLLAHGAVSVDVRTLIENDMAGLPLAERLASLLDQDAGDAMADTAEP
jgi:hypothetical protein